MSAPATTSAKPFDFGEVAGAAARAACARARRAPAASSRSATAVVDPAHARRRRAAGAPVTLTAREFAVREHPARHAGQGDHPHGGPRPRLGRALRGRRRTSRRVRRRPAPQARAARSDARSCARSAASATRWRPRHEATPIRAQHDGLVRAPAGGHRRSRLGRLPGRAAARRPDRRASTRTLQPVRRQIADGYRAEGAPEAVDVARTVWLTGARRRPRRCSTRSGRVCVSFDDRGVQGADAGSRRRRRAVLRRRRG